jgi:hypothetical protein|tara:strand:- start:47 stop:280 length:234 start_codon:yes stop_codon:yes gene_type:complete
MSLKDKDIESLQLISSSVRNISDILTTHLKILDKLSKNIVKLKLQLEDSPFLNEPKEKIEDEIERLNRAREFAGDTP